VKRLLLTAAVVATAGTAMAQPTMWGHNGSLMELVAYGPHRTFTYREPRPGMWDAGARPGNPVFDGEHRGNGYWGTAYVYSASCGAIAYPVSGPVDDRHNVVTLYGQAPRVDPYSCTVITTVPDVLVFHFLGR
jgi:hypothetical protein